MKQTREQGKMTQEVKVLVRRLYPATAEEMVMVLACDFFTDALYDQQLQIYIMQPHLQDLQVGLAIALECEAFLKTISGKGEAALPCHDLQSWTAKMTMKATLRHAWTVFTVNVGVVTRRGTDAVGVQGSKTSTS